MIARRKELVIRRAPIINSLAKLGILGALLGLAPPALAQSTSSQGDSSSSAQSSKRDVEVIGKRLQEKQPTTVRQGVPPAAALQNRTIYDQSEQMARCAVNRPVDKIRAVVDGVVNSAPQRAAVVDMLRSTITCNAQPGIIADLTPVSGGISGVAGGADGGSSDGGTAGNLFEKFRSQGGTSIYDRGAILIEAIRAYAPDISLTKEETLDASVQQRFNEREGPRNRFREPADYRYFEIAVCMVRMQPELSVMLLDFKANKRESSDIQSRLINGARRCVGNAKTVKVDATQFRLYIADALYRWVVAARGVDTLIVARQTAATK